MSIKSPYKPLLSVASDPSRQKFRLFDLPAELRINIFRQMIPCDHIFFPNGSMWYQKYGTGYPLSTSYEFTMAPLLPILHSSRQLRQEVLTFLATERMICTNRDGASRVFVMFGAGITRKIRRLVLDTFDLPCIGGMAELPDAYYDELLVRLDELKWLRLSIGRRAISILREQNHDASESDPSAEEILLHPPFQEVMKLRGLDSFELEVFRFNDADFASMPNLMAAALSPLRETLRLVETRICAAVTQP